MVLNKNDADLSIPKILLNFMFEKVAFTLEENQFGEIMGAVDSFALFHRGIKVGQHTFMFSQIGRASCRERV